MNLHKINRTAKVSIVSVAMVSRPVVVHPRLRCRVCVHDDEPSPRA